jgi:hypothetical protein
MLIGSYRRLLSHINRSADSLFIDTPVLRARLRLGNCAICGFFGLLLIICVLIEIWKKMSSQWEISVIRYRIGEPLIESDDEGFYRRFLNVLKRKGNDIWPI